MSPGRPDEPASGIIAGLLQRGEPIAAPPGDASELLTFFFADIRGYTKFTQQRGDEAAAKLTAKFAMIVRDLVAQYGGTVFELRGDEALCVFGSPRQSLRLAVALQQRFVEETIADARLPMTVGIGIDAGEAVHGEDGYRGGALNLAARLCAQAKAGEILASPEVTHLARTIDGIRYVVLDRVALKGLSDRVRPVRVFPEGEDPAQQIAALLAAATPSSTGAQPVRWLPGPLATRPRAALAAVAVAVVGAAVLVVALQHGGGGIRLAALRENSLGILDPGTGHLVGQVGVEVGPSAAAAGYDSVWTANTDADSVSRVDTSSRQPSQTIEVGAAPSAIAVGLGSVWVANGDDATVSRIDPATNQPRTIPVGAAPGGLVVAGGSVWVTNTAAGTVSRIDPSQNAVVETVPVGSSPGGIGAGRNIWVANSADGTVSKIDGRSHAVSPPIRVGNDPKSIAVIGDSVWVTNNLDGTVSRFATSGTPVPGTVRVGPEPTQIAAVDRHVWVATQANEAVAEIDPGATRVVRTVPLGAVPGGLVGAAGRLWVTTTIDPALHRGGTINIVGSGGTGGTGEIDPVYVDDLVTLYLSNGMYDGLVGFRHATGADGTALVPDLATAIPEPTNGGRTCAFQLRTGIRWSTGAPLTVFDVRRGLQRAIASGFSALKQQILGAGRCTPSRCDLPGIAVDPAAGTVTITLVRPDGNFLDDLTAGLAAPAATPLANLKTNPIPATGAYRISRYVPGKLVELTRNPFFHQWSAAAQPDGFPDSIRWRIGPSGREPQQVDEVAAAHSDWADARGTAAIGALEARFGARLYRTPTETMHGLFLNTRVAPFDDARVRRALAYAVDRAAIAADWFTPATITCQLLPPNYPGYRPYCPYTVRPDATGTWTAPDFPEALRLVKASHTKGMTVTVFAEDAQPFGHIVQALTDLGYHAHLSVDHKGDTHYFPYVSDSRNKVQAGFFGWVAGDVSAANSLAVYKCNAFTPASPNNINPAQFCDPSIDALMGRAARAQVSSPAAGNELWAQVDRRIVDAAPWIPLVNPTWLDVVSSRVHNYQRSPVLGVFFDQMWVR